MHTARDYPVLAAWLNRHRGRLLFTVEAPTGARIEAWRLYSGRGVLVEVHPDGCGWEIWTNAGLNNIGAAFIDAEHRCAVDPGGPGRGPGGLYWPGYVRLEDGPAFRALIHRVRWNGCARPLFDAATCEQIADWTNGMGAPIHDRTSDDDPDSLPNLLGVRLHRDGDRWVGTYVEDNSTDTWEPVDVDGVPYWGIGAEFWAWWKITSCAACNDDLRQDGAPLFCDECWSWPGV